jgi:hypothetical protein
MQPLRPVPLAATGPVRDPGAQTPGSMEKPGVSQTSNPHDNVYQSGLIYRVRIGA